MRSSTSGDPRKNPRKLTDEQVKEILWFLKHDGKKRGAAGYKNQSTGLIPGLAKHYRVSVETIKDIKKRRRYKHIKRRKIEVRKWQNIR